MEDEHGVVKQKEGTTSKGWEFCIQPGQDGKELRLLLFHFPWVRWNTKVRNGGLLP